MAVMPSRATEVTERARTAGFPVRGSTMGAG